jgi:hypothetical protein
VFSVGDLRMEGGWNSDLLMCYITYGDGSMNLDILSLNREIGQIYSCRLS